MLAMQFLLKVAEEGPDSSLAWILYGGLGVFFLMILVGWTVSSLKRKSSE